MKKIIFVFIILYIILLAFYLVVFSPIRDVIFLDNLIKEICISFNVDNRVQCFNTLYPIIESY